MLPDFRCVLLRVVICDLHADAAAHAGADQRRQDFEKPREGLHRIALFDPSPRALIQGGGRAGCRHDRRGAVIGVRIIVKERGSPSERSYPRWRQTKCDDNSYFDQTSWQCPAII